MDAACSLQNKNFPELLSQENDKFLNTEKNEQRWRCSNLVQWDAEKGLE